MTEPTSNKTLKYIAKAEARIAFTKLTQLSNASKSNAAAIYDEWIKVATSSEEKKNLNEAKIHYLENFHHMNYLLCQLKFRLRMFDYENESLEVMNEIENSCLEFLSGRLARQERRILAKKLKEKSLEFSKLSSVVYGLLITTPLSFFSLMLPLLILKGSVELLILPAFVLIYMTFILSFYSEFSSKRKNYEDAGNILICLDDINLRHSSSNEFITFEESTYYHSFMRLATLKKASINDAGDVYEEWIRAAKSSEEKENLLKAKLNYLKHFNTINPLLHTLLYRINKIESYLNPSENFNNIVNLTYGFLAGQVSQQDYQALSKDLQKDYSKFKYLAIASMVLSIASLTIASLVGPALGALGWIPIGLASCLLFALVAEFVKFFERASYVNDTAETIMRLSQKCIMASAEDKTVCSSKTNDSLLFFSPSSKLNSPAEELEKDKVEDQSKQMVI